MVCSIYLYCCNLASFCSKYRSCLQFVSQIDDIPLDMAPFSGGMHFYVSRDYMHLEAISWDSTNTDKIQSSLQFAIGKIGSCLLRDPTWQAH